MSNGSNFKGTFFIESDIMSTSKTSGATCNGVSHTAICAVADAFEMKCDVTKRKPDRRFERACKSVREEGNVSNGKVCFA